MLNVALASALTAHLIGSQPQQPAAAGAKSAATFSNVRMIQNNHRLSPQYANGITSHPACLCLPPGVAQQIGAQPDDVLLHDGELVTQAAGLDQCPTEIVLEQAPAGCGQAHPHLPLVGGIADAADMAKLCHEHLLVMPSRFRDAP
jgi:hypothetical protein